MVAAVWPWVVWGWEWAFWAASWGWFAFSQTVAVGWCVASLWKLADERGEG